MIPNRPIQDAQNWNAKNELPVFQLFIGQYTYNFSGGFRFETEIANFAKEYLNPKPTELNRELRKNLLKSFNYLNLSVSFLLVILFAIFYVIRINLLPVYIHFILFRTIMRSIGIMKAFLKDIVDKNPKQSNLTSQERVALALLSFLEMIILYTLVYLFIPNDECVWVKSEFDSIIRYIVNYNEINLNFFTFLDKFFYSFGVMTYKSISFIS